MTPNADFNFALQTQKFNSITEQAPSPRGEGGGEVKKSIL